MKRLAVSGAPEGRRRTTSRLHQLVMKAVLRGRAGEISYKILYKKLRNGSGYDMSRMPVFRKM